MNSEQWTSNFGFVRFAAVDIYNFASTSRAEDLWAGGFDNKHLTAFSTLFDDLQMLWLNYKIDIVIASQAYACHRMLFVTYSSDLSIFRLSGTLSQNK